MSHWTSSYRGMVVVGWDSAGRACNCSSRSVMRVCASANWPCVYFSFFSRRLNFLTMSFAPFRTVASSRWTSTNAILRGESLMSIHPSSAFLIRQIFPRAHSSSIAAVPASARWIICISVCSSAMRWDNVICCPAKNPSLRRCYRFGAEPQTHVPHPESRGTPSPHYL